MTRDSFANTWNQELAGGSGRDDGGEDVGTGLTREQIEAIKNFNDAAHEKMDDDKSWDYVWQHHEQEGGHIKSGTVVDLCDLALRGLDADKAFNEGLEAAGVLADEWGEPEMRDAILELKRPS